MKLTLAEIRWMQRGLSIIAGANLPIKVAYRLNKLINFCNEELLAIEEARVQLVKRFSNDSENEQAEIKVAPENEDAFRQEFAQLLQEEVEVDFSPIKISDLGENINISPSDLASLSKIIEE